MEEKTNLEKLKEAKKWAEENDDKDTAETFGNVLKWLDDTEHLGK